MYNLRFRERCRGKKFIASIDKALENFRKADNNKNNNVRSAWGPYTGPKTVKTEQRYSVNRYPRVIEVCQCDGRLNMETSSPKVNRTHRLACIGCNE